jgi:hypothetical protein
MHTNHLAVCLVLCFTAVSQASDKDPGAELKQNQPPVVAALVDRIISCNHWSGESPYDADRAKEINTALSELHCAQLKGDESTILSTFQTNPAVKKAIDAAHELFL